MEFISKELDQYCTTHTSPEAEILAKLNRETHLNIMQPRMLSGHFQGRLLSMFSHMIKPKTILEIGTYTGYSALCLAEGMHPDGKLLTIDINEELNEMVSNYFRNAGQQDRILPIIGDAMTIIPEMEEEFDLVFIDADKKNYINYYNLVFDKVRSGGYIIADNMLWSGKVLETAEKLDRETKVIHEYNEMIQNDERVENILLPIRDGLMVARKK